jgi:hypothetical protein
MPMLRATYSSFLNQIIRTGLTATIFQSEVSILKMSKFNFSTSNFTYITLAFDMYMSFLWGIFRMILLTVPSS